MNKLCDILAFLCLLLVTLLSSRTALESPIRVAKPLLITFNFHSPSVAALHDSQMEFVQMGLAYGDELSQQDQHKKGVKLQAGVAPQFLVRHFPKL